MKVCKTYSKIVQNGSIFSKTSDIVWKMNEPEYYHRQKAMWDENELKDIMDEYENKKMNISEIADAHFRTPGSIAYKLKNMKLITHNTLAKGYQEYKESKLYKTIVAKGKLEDAQKKLKYAEAMRNVSDETPLSVLKEIRDLLKKLV
jgi:hypothetical protein